jgi:deoxycytidine triphosphate deaminase
MLLNSDQILELLQTNGHGAKAQVGYDLTLKAAKKIVGGVVTQDKTAPMEYVELMPTKNPAGKLMFAFKKGVYSLTFDQGIKLPSNRTAFIRHRSSILRCGSFITSGVYDPGFEVDEMGAVLFVEEDLFIEKGARVAQVIVFENNTAELYNGQWQGSKDLK